LTTVRVIPLALTFLLPALSCGGSGGSTAGVVEPAVCLEFAPDADPSPGTVVARRGGATTCDRLALDLIITDLGDVFAVDFKLGFDPAILRYDGYVATGSVLEADGAPVTVLTDVKTGLLELTIARLGAEWGGIDVVGSQFLLRVYFVRNADSGGSPLSFSGGRIWNGAGELIPGVAWFGGSVTIR